jgi:hypothetical protein
MHIQVNTGSGIEGGEQLTLEIESTIEATLGRFRERITRVEVHLTDGNSHKSGANDKQCVIEARPRGMQPVAVTHTASTPDEAVTGAAGKLERLLDSAFGKLKDQRGRPE